ncbi:MAG: VOC family protein [Legionella sp.]|nr:VOC family protein [Legionella sp.]
MFEPNAIVLYVDNLTITSAFYQDILGMKPEEASPSFHAFKLSNGMSLGLKTRETVEPPPTDKNGSGELAFILDTHEKVNDLFAKWQAKGITIPLPPTLVMYGYTFLALDPDGNRLRVVAMRKD